MPQHTSLAKRLRARRALHVLEENASFHQNKKPTYWSVSCFGGSGWIRTTEGGANRFTVCPLWPLGNTPIFIFIKKWSWWTDLNPRPADYKSAALPTELHQRLMLEQYNTIIFTCQAYF